MNTVLNDYRGRGGPYKWSWWRPACLGWTPVSPSSSSWPCSVLLWGDTGQEWPVPRGEYVIGVASWGVVNGPGREGENGLLIELIHFILFMPFFQDWYNPKNLKMEICWKRYDILIHSSNKLKSKDSSKESNKYEVNDGDDDEGDEISVPMIIIFFILVCTFLVLLYFFYEYLGKYM